MTEVRIDAGQLSFGDRTVPLSNLRANRGSGGSIAFLADASLRDYDAVARWVAVGGDSMVVGFLDVAVTVHARPYLLGSTWERESTPSATLILNPVDPRAAAEAIASAIPRESSCTSTTS